MKVLNEAHILEEIAFVSLIYMAVTNLFLVAVLDYDALMKLFPIWLILVFLLLDAGKVSMVFKLTFSQSQRNNKPSNMRGNLLQYLYVSSGVTVSAGNEIYTILKVIKL